MANALSQMERGSAIKAVFICLFITSGSLLFGIDAGELGGFMAMTRYTMAGSRVRALADGSSVFSRITDTTTPRPSHTI